MTTGRNTVVCWKWVSLDGETDADRRWAGVSHSDEAALEIALRLRDARRAPDTAEPDGRVTVVCLGPAAADGTLRDALAAGADDVLRIDASTELDSHAVAIAIATTISNTVGTCQLVVCGDASVDRGTGSVPAYLADELGAAQALGLVTVGDVPTDDAPLRVVRRLDGGRRERLDVPTPAVISVEGAAARLRRAGLSASLASRTATINVVPGPAGRLPDAEIHPFRPRTRSVPAPRGDTLTRIRDLLDIGGVDVHAEVVELEPAAAATRIVEQLRDWGYLDEDAPGSSGDTAPHR